MRFDLTRYWYDPSPTFITLLLLPLSWLFGAVVTLRRWLYRKNIYATHQIKTPVIVVGNITVGGTGKTPLVIWLASLVESLGYTPGIVSRGVGGVLHKTPYVVKNNADAALVGDEALLLTKQNKWPLVICKDRVAAANYLLQNTPCNIIISDDGLQHYRLGRQIEIAVVDSDRRFGNQYLLPAGPLRESLARLNEVDFTIVNGGNDTDAYRMSLEPQAPISLLHPEKIFSLDGLPTKKIHAVAAIGHPERYFKMLEKMGYQIIPHAFPDHHLYRPEDLQFNDAYPILMTEKDAVKCVSFADDRYWYVPVVTKVNEQFKQQIINKLQKMGLK